MTAKPLLCYRQRSFPLSVYVDRNEDPLELLDSQCIALLDDFRSVRIGVRSQNDTFAPRIGVIPI